MKLALAVVTIMTVVSAPASAFDKSLDLSLGLTNGEGGYVNGARVTGNQTQSIRIGGTYGRWHGAVEYGDPTNEADATAKDRLNVSAGLDVYRLTPRTTLSIEAQANSHGDNWSDYGVGVGAKYQNDYVSVGVKGGYAESEDSVLENGNWREVDVKVTHPKLKGFYAGAKHSVIDFDSTIPFVDDVKYEVNTGYVGYEHKF